jgi:hypothetical protein
MQVLTKETAMLSMRKTMFGFVAIVILLTMGTAGRTKVSASEMASGGAQAANPAVPIPAPRPGKVAAGQVESTKLLLLMDADKNGKVSRAEFMAFMAAEFDRLDTDHNGELNVEELERSQLAVAHRGGTHR